MAIIGILNKMKWNEKGLVETIVQDNETKDILMLAYSNKESLEKTLKTGIAWYYSRSRKKVWMKGEESGNIQKIKNIFIDCDEDTLLFLVNQRNGSCHKGYKSCFFRKIEAEGIKLSNEKVFDPKEIYGVKIINELFQVIKDRKRNPKKESYTSKLFSQGNGKISEKFLEECEELINSNNRKGKDGMVWEAADVIYFLLVFLVYNNVELSHVFNELRGRRK